MVKIIPYVCVCVCELGTRCMLVCVGVCLCVCNLYVWRERGGSYSPECKPYIIFH